MRKRKCLKAIDLFAGVGGSSAGARAAGIRVVGAVDLWEVAESNYKENFPEVTFFRSRCEQVDLDHLKQKIGHVDLILASPECTSHTCAKGSARRSEKSRETAFQVLNFAAALNPRWIVVENVVHMRKWKRFDGWIRKIQSLGYQVTQQVINSADHGVAQSRRRLFLLCDRTRKPAKIKPTKKTSKFASKIVDSNGHYAFSPLRTEKRANATLERAERAIKALGKKKPFLLVYYGSDAAGGWQKLQRPLRTITTVDRFAYVRPCKDGHEMRMLQVPELKAAMGFPAKHKLSYGTRRDQIKLLGNAVCPPVMEAAIRSLLRNSK
ncbi:MAG TPA: DNA cytosine methyltransferase [Terriglobales bacterium]|nr:DNA cytosine methyltransferase [Terriglobales bacterium]